MGGGGLPFELTILRKDGCDIFKCRVMGFNGVAELAVHRTNTNPNGKQFQNWTPQKPMAYSISGKELLTVTSRGKDWGRKSTESVAVHSRTQRQRGHNISVFF